MPIARFQMPDGRVARFEVPDGTTPEQAQTMMQAHFAQPQQPAQTEDKGVLQNIGAGALKGASDIGATILSPLDKTGLTGMTPDERRQKLMDFFTQHANPSSLPFNAGEVGSDIAGTAGAGGLLAKGAEAIPAIAKFAPALASGGFNLGEASTGSKLANALMRSGAGAIQGGTQASMINPAQAESGAGIGAVVPGLPAAANAIGGGLKSGAQRLMQSALKPTIAQLKSGAADTAAKTLLSEGINATKGGVDTLKSRIGDVNQQIADAISGSNATVDKQSVIDALNPVMQKFSTQVNPAGDIAAIESAGSQFAANPMVKGDTIPVQLAQALKQGTYAVLSKKYGQLGSADTEAQKALARGLKEGIANAVTEVAGLNARDSALINTLNVTERRALMDANKNPMGLALLAHNPATWAAFMADKSALFKSLAARMLNQTGSGLQGAPQIQGGTYGIPSVVGTQQ